MPNSSVFVSYSHKDEEWKDRVVTHLRVLQMDDTFDVWDDRRIEAGDDWYPEIEKAINNASVAILLISANFLTSKFILGEEVPKLLERREKAGVRIIPVIVKPCAWAQVKWLSKIQSLPKDGRSLSGGTENQIDTDLTDLVKEIARIIEDTDPKSGKASPKPVPPRPKQARIWPIWPRTERLPFLRKGIRNPFPSDPVAERESPWLFAREKALFWEHPLLAKLQHVPKLHEEANTVVAYGLPGLGKTSMALKLGRYEHDSFVLSCYLKGTPTLHDIQQAFAGQILTFVRFNPTYLSRLGTHERSLLASSLLHALDRWVVLTEISQFISKYQEQVVSGSLDEKRATEAVEESISQLSLLREAVEGATLNQVSVNGWSQTLLSCARFLNFEELRFVVDTDVSFPKDWLDACILAYEQAWNSVKANILLFWLPPTSDQFQSLPYLLSDVQALEWNGRILENMLRHRWAAANGAIALDSYFSDRALKTFLRHAQGSPRRLSQLWNLLPWHETSKTVISLSDVNAAAERCP